MPRFIEGEDRAQASLFPERLDDYIAEDNAVRLIEAFVNGLDLEALGFQRVEPRETGRPAYHATTLLKIYIYGYLNRIPSGRRLEQECERNVEMMWLTRRLVPDHKTICEFRKHNTKGLVRVCLLRGRLDLPQLHDKVAVHDERGAATHSALDV